MLSDDVGDIFEADRGAIAVGDDEGAEGGRR